MRNWDTRDESGTDEGCEWKKDWEDVQRVCKVLDIPVKLVRDSFVQYTAVRMFAKWFVDRFVERVLAERL